MDIYRLTTVLILVVLFSGNVQAGISPSRTEINMGVIPVDHYADPATTGPAYFPSCPAGNTLRQCVQWFFNNDSGVAPVNTNNYVRQGVKGVRFLFGLGGGSASTPFDNEGNVQAAWVNNLALFLGDLRRFGIESITPYTRFAGFVVGKLRCGLHQLRFTDCRELWSIEAVELLSLVTVRPGPSQL
jgi:hypothetical protein